MTPDPNPAEVQSPRRIKGARTVPGDAIVALGGAPLTPPSIMRARRIARPDRADRPASRARAATSAAPEGPARAANPLFDGPADDSETARRAIHRARKALGHVARLITEAVDAIDALPAGDALTGAAARESFDLAQAKSIRDELAAFLDRHKPVQKS